MARSEMRFDPLEEKWVLLSEKRGKRPKILEGEKAPCPFCVGNEYLVPSDVLRMPEGAEKHNWQVRVVPNRYGALEPGMAQWWGRADVFLTRSAQGVQEVIIDHPYHDHRHPADLTDDEQTLVFRAAYLRLKELFLNLQLSYPVLFKNHGLGGNASVEHPHWQLIVLPVVPKKITRMVDSFMGHRERYGGCVLCRMIHEEKNTGERLVAENEQFIAWVPYAAGFQYELMVAPKIHLGRFEAIEEKEVRLVAGLYGNLLRRMRRVTHDAGFNIVLFSAPWFSSERHHPEIWKVSGLCFHWYLRILPRISGIGGLELASGDFMNSVFPEDAAEAYRSCGV